MNVHKAVFGLVGAVFSTPCVAGTHMVKLCYTPFSYETVVPITPSSIVEQRCKIIDGADSTVAQLYKDVQTKPKSIAGQQDFDFLTVRLEILDGNKPPIFVDKRGVVLVSNERYQVDATVLASMEKLLNGLFGYSDK